MNRHVAFDATWFPIAQIGNLVTRDSNHGVQSSIDQVVLGQSHILSSAQPTPAAWPLIFSPQYSNGDTSRAT